MYIKDIPRHVDIQTRQQYLHVRKEQLVTIISPLDDLWKKGGIENIAKRVCDTTSQKSEKKSIDNQ